MRKLLVSMSMFLAVVSGNGYADGKFVSHGVIRFTGSIVKSPCPQGSAAWLSHAGRSQGLSPASAGDLPELRNNCAGVVETQSVSFQPLSGTKQGAKGGVVTVVYN
ncbi:hypothetical protein [Metapseudomonas resinovorans]|uniref:Type 1 fimbrial protein n=1 Tax=Metapseudomonas resinovorans NBRC 106553 TaxID=1245471 RepID=S6BAS1_METRE|nr:hypothetical protein [Pseudomonas resinovorans]BAN46159.1 hypothetical protein PCA10_04270 [Pseudomonas resinovorans NBRC 106553]